MKKTAIIILVFLLSCSAKKEQVGSSYCDSLAQRKPNYNLLKKTNCIQPKLSNQFDISVDCKKNIDTNSFEQLNSLRILITDKKKSSIIDSINIKSNHYYDFMFSSCESQRSYTTGYNFEKEVIDNYFGDIVVADFNFDNLDDLAVVIDEGGNGGPIYNFYIQLKNRKFTKNIFLTDTMRTFPSIIDKKTKSLTTYVHANAMQEGENIYQLNNSKNWIKKSHKLINYRTE